jgi:transmembrane sensor
MVAGVDRGKDMDISDEMLIADAAAWIARLQRGDRTRATEAAFHEWLSDPAHARAYARVADVWEIIPGAAQSLEKSGRSSGVRPIVRGALVAIAAAVLAVVGLVAIYLTRTQGYHTAIGQQQVLTLADESRVALNTDSRLTVDYSSKERRVTLDRGEALFEVAQSTDRAFIVQAGDTEVRALGTKFDVRRSDGRVIVVLLEGKVEVTNKPPVLAKAVRVATLSPGQRLTLGTDDGVTAVDRPNVEAATAWRRGEVMFEDAKLSEAVAEMNRYARVRVTLADPELESLRVSGVFESQGAEEFAESMAVLHHLRIERQANALILSATAPRR